MTRAPRVMVSLTFSAISRQHTTSKKDVASSHSWVWRFCQRRLTANPKVTLAWPVLVKRSSGSRVTFPTSITLLSVAMSAPLRQPAAGAAAAALSGRRTTLWRTTSSARPSMRSSAATVSGSPVNSTMT